MERPHSANPPNKATGVATIARLVAPREGEGEIAKGKANRKLAARKHAARLVFIVPRASSSFDVRRHKVKRAGVCLPRLSSRVRGLPGPGRAQGVIFDAGCRGTDDVGGLWLLLHVTVSFS